MCIWKTESSCCAPETLYKSTILLVTPQTIACQAPLSMEFSRQEYWSGLLCPPPGNLPDPGIELGSPLL